MKIYDFKSQFEEAMNFNATLSVGAAEMAWKYFKEAMHERLNEAYVDEIGFSAGESHQFDRVKVGNYDSLFLVYFGRTIDADPPNSWSVAESECYFSYEMTDKLRILAKMLQNETYAFEVHYSSADDKAVIDKKIHALCAFADEKQEIWDTIRGLAPVSVTTYFQIR